MRNVTLNNFPQTLSRSRVVRRLRRIVSHDGHLTDLGKTMMRVNPELVRTLDPDANTRKQAILAWIAHSDKGCPHTDGYIHKRLQHMHILYGDLHDYARIVDAAVVQDFPKTLEYLAQRDYVRVMSGTLDMVALQLQSLKCLAVLRVKKFGRHTRAMSIVPVYTKPAVYHKSK